MIQELKRRLLNLPDIYQNGRCADGMEVPGVVTNITRFGAFIDIGVKQDGLVHVSEISHTYITDPNEALKLNQQVKVKVTGSGCGTKKDCFIYQTNSRNRLQGNNGNKPQGQLHQQNQKQNQP